MQLSMDERQQNRLLEESLQHAVNQMRVNGHLVIEKLFDSLTITDWHREYRQLFDPFIERVRSSNTNGHFRMDLPYESPFVDEELVANPIVMQIMEALLGQDYICQYFASNTCMPGSGYQDIHSDLHALYPEADITLPPVAIVLSVALVYFRHWFGAAPLRIPEDKYRSFPEQVQRLFRKAIVLES